MRCSADWTQGQRAVRGFRDVQRRLHISELPWTGPFALRCRCRSRQLSIAGVWHAHLIRQGAMRHTPRVEDGVTRVDFDRQRCGKNTALQANERRQ